MSDAPRSRAPAQVVPLVYDLAVWVAPRIATFPRLQRHPLGERLMSAHLQVLESLHAAQYAPRRTHRAIATVRRWVRSHPWALQVDVRRYFHNIDHSLLLAELRRHGADRRLLALLSDLVATHLAPAKFQAAVPPASLNRDQCGAACP